MAKEKKAKDEAAKAKAAKAEDLTGDDLQKSLDQLNEFAASNDAQTRKQVLLEKALTETLPEAERTELFGLMGEEPGTDEASLSGEVKKGMEDNKTVQGALDVSDFLRENNIEVTKSMGLLADHIEQSDNRQSEFNLMLAKAVSDIGNHVVAVSTRLGCIESQPAHAPKSKGVPTAPLKKAFADQPPGDAGDLSKSEVLDALEEMVMKSVDSGMNGATVDGTDLAMATSKFEQLNRISPKLLKQVKAHIESKGATTH